MPLTNVEEAVSSLYSLTEDWRDAAARGAAQAGAEFKEYLRSTQLSGRPGLNIRSGDLFNDIDSDIESLAHEVVSRVFNQNPDKTFYWYFHQIGVSETRSSAFGKPTRPYERILPKRLNVFESWEDVGYSMHENRVREALQRVFA